MKAGGLASFLTQCLVAGDINGCCGILRRIYSEALREESDAALAAQTHDWIPRAGPSPAALASVERSLRRESVKPASRTDARSASSASSRGPTTVQQILGLGHACLRDNPGLVKSSSVSILCNTAQRHGQWRDALDLCRYLSQRPSPTFLASLLTPSNHEAVWECCKERGWPLDVPSAIRALAQEHGSWSAALATAQAVEAYFPLGEPYAAAVLVPYLAASGEQEKALELFKGTLAQGTLTEPGLVQQIIMQTAEMRQWETSLRMLRALTTTQEAPLLLPSSVEFFRRLMESSPSWKASMLIFDTARAVEVKPDKRTVSILLSQCDESGAWLAATRVYDVAKREGFVDSLSDGRSYHALVRSFSAARQWEKALEALSWMTKAGEASLGAGMSELVELCEQSGQWAAALTVGEALLQSNPELLTENTALALLFACAKGGQWLMAANIFHRQVADVRSQPHPLALCAVLQACAASQRWDAAVRVLQEARAQQPRIVIPPVAHRLAVKACGRSGQWERVLGVLEWMREDGLPQDNHSQRLGLWAAALSGQWQLSLSFLQRIPLHARTAQDRMVVRATTRQVGPLADAVALRLLQQSVPKPRKP